MVEAHKCGLPTLRLCDHWFRRRVSVWITCVNSFRCLRTLSTSTYWPTFNFIFIQFSIRPSPGSLSSRYHTIYFITLSTTYTMSDIRSRQPTCSLSPPAHHKRMREPSDEPMSPGDRAHRCSDKRRAACSPSPHHRWSLSRKGHHEKCRRVTSHDDSPPPPSGLPQPLGSLSMTPETIALSA